MKRMPAGPSPWHSPCYSTGTVLRGSAGWGLPGPGAARPPGAQALADLALAAAIARLVVEAGAPAPRAVGPLPASVPVGGGGGGARAAARGPPQRRGGLPGGGRG